MVFMPVPNACVLKKIRENCSRQAAEEGPDVRDTFDYTICRTHDCALGTCFRCFHESLEPGSKGCDERRAQIDAEFRVRSLILVAFFVLLILFLVFAPHDAPPTTSGRPSVEKGDR